jgi:hypothetical protein
MLSIATRSSTEAECIVRELVAFEPELSGGDGTWMVTIERDAELPEILSALETCLTTIGIASIRVRIDGRSYVLEPAA